ncbi:MAG: hypothetical protein K8R60_24285 [Burkholderiales bacterium]|nr:hypothetical protein [Burkholderiales bacterium]
MSTLTDRIDHFVRWFFDVSPTSMTPETAPQRYRTATTKRAARPASPKERREPRNGRRATTSRSGSKERT